MHVVRTLNSRLKYIIIKFINMHKEMAMTVWKIKLWYVSSIKFTQLS